MSPFGKICNDVEGTEKKIWKKMKIKSFSTSKLVHWHNTTLGRNITCRHPPPKNPTPIEHNMHA